MLTMIASAEECITAWHEGSVDELRFPNLSFGLDFAPGIRSILDNIVFRTIPCRIGQRALSHAANRILDVTIV
jgi:hypothetical protein